MNSTCNVIQCTYFVEQRGAKTVVSGIESTSTSRPLVEAWISTFPFSDDTWQWLEVLPEKI